MKKLLYTLLLSFVAFLTYAQAPLIPSVRCSLTTVTVFTDPYTVVGKTVDFSSNWQASDISAGDSLYLMDGNELRVYQVVSISSAAGTDFTIVINDINNSGSVPVTGEYGALFRGTSNFDFPNVTAGISETLQMAIQNRFVQRLDALLDVTGIEYITTDSFSTFINSKFESATFSDVPIGAFVWRTTTGNKYQKISSTSMSLRSSINGANASTILNSSTNSLSFSSRLNAHVRMNTTGNPSAATVNTPIYNSTSSVTVGSEYLIGVTAGTSNLTITWDTIYGLYDKTSGFSNLGTTYIPASSTVEYKFRVVVGAAETIRLQLVDNVGTGNSGIDSIKVALTGAYTGLKKLGTDSIGFDPAGQVSTVPGGGIAAGDLFAAGDISSGSAVFIPFSQVVGQLRDSIPVPTLTAAEGVEKNSNQFRLGGSYFLSHPSEFTAARKLNWGNFKSYIGTDNADSLKYVVFDIPNKRLGLGRTSPWAKMNIMGDANTSATFAFGVGNSDTTFFLLRNDGAMLQRNLTGSTYFSSMPFSTNLTNAFWGRNAVASNGSFAIGDNSYAAGSGSFSCGPNTTIDVGHTNSTAYGYGVVITTGVSNNIFGSGPGGTGGFLSAKESYTSFYGGYSIAGQLKLTGASTNTTNAWTAVANVVTSASAHGFVAGENIYLIGSSVLGATVRRVISTTSFEVFDTPSLLSGTGFRAFGTAFPVRFAVGNGGTGERPFAGMDKRGNWVFGGGIYNNSIPSTPYGRFDLRKDTVNMEAWGAKGVGFNSNAATYIDQSTAASGTATTAVINAFGIPTISAKNTSVTITNAATVYIEGAPVAGTNTTITNAPSLWVDAGATRLDGALRNSSNSDGTTGQVATSAGAGNPWTWSTLRYDIQKNSAASGATTTLVDDGTSLTLWVVVDSVVGTSTIIQIPNPVAGLSKVEVIVTFQGFASGATALITTPGGTNVVTDRQNFPSAPYRASITVDETKVGSEYHFKLNTANTIWLQGS